MYIYIYMYILQVDRCPHIWLWPNRLHFWLGDLKGEGTWKVLSGFRKSRHNSRLQSRWIFHVGGVVCFCVRVPRWKWIFRTKVWASLCFYWPPHAYVSAHPNRRIRSVHLAYLDHPGGYLHYNLEKSPTSITVYITHFMSKIPWRRKWHRHQCPCRGNPMDRGAWRATVHGVARESGTT